MVARHGGDAAGFAIGIDEGLAHEAIVAVPADCEDALNEARAVIVIWTKAAGESNWRGID